MQRDTETEWEGGGYLQWFSSNGVNIRIQTNIPWDELEVSMRDFYTERAEEYFRVRHHTDLGRIEL
jgi:hypothetical protein